MSEEKDPMAAVPAELDKFTAAQAVFHCGDGSQRWRAELASRVAARLVDVRHVVDAELTAGGLKRVEPRPTLDEIADLAVRTVDAVIARVHRGR